ncbi:hypothetical protein D3870_14305 [Noviherbaspirillum cavernae]|uniref:Uncharacterized protein n=1 Tax=Noviherbaspirillum cavernae TaxID=2320862 RepID=A0A418X3K3_9BURK|nr:hypothetical protein [Noviherbaspirillum cavernae]RJG07016.1 hypothetical protein D3870_14305 [Noviherbaspirillum cavernae]
MIDGEPQVVHYCGLTFDMSGHPQASEGLGSTAGDVMESKLHLLGALDTLTLKPTAELRDIIKHLLHMLRKDENVREEKCWQGCSTSRCNRISKRVGAGIHFVDLSGEMENLCFELTRRGEWARVTSLSIGLAISKRATKECSRHSFGSASLSSSSLMERTAARNTIAFRYSSKECLYRKRMGSAASSIA